MEKLLPDVANDLDRQELVEEVGKYYAHLTAGEGDCHEEAATRLLPFVANEPGIQHYASIVRPTTYTGRPGMIVLFYVGRTEEPFDTSAFPKVTIDGTIRQVRFRHMLATSRAGTSELQALCDMLKGAIDTSEKLP